MLTRPGEHKSRDRPQLKLGHQSKLRHLGLQLVSIEYHRCEGSDYDGPGTGGAAVEASAVVISSGRLRSAVGAGIFSDCVRKEN